MWGRVFWSFIFTWLLTQWGFFPMGEGVSLIAGGLLGVSFLLGC